MSNLELMKIAEAAGMIMAAEIEEIEEDLVAIDLAGAKAIEIHSMEDHAAADLEVAAISIEGQITDIEKEAAQEIAVIFNDLYI